MRRRLFTLLSALSLLLCVAVVVLWVRSHWRTQFVFWRGEGDDNLHLIVAAGRINLEGATAKESLVAATGAPGMRVLSGPAYDYRTRVYREERRGGSGIRRRWDAGGFSGFSHDSGRARWWWLSLPCWAVALAAAILPCCWGFGWAVAWNRRRRQRNGLCPSWGYDLRATPGRCPECGAVPVAKGTT